MFGGNFAPSGWALCNGQILSIGSNTALFSLVGTTFGGNGVNNFALPDLRGRVPIHMGQGTGLSNYILGQTGGAETVTLTLSNLPPHTHSIKAVGQVGDIANPTNALPAIGSKPNYYSNAAGNVTMSAAMVAPSGSGLPANNVQPYLCVNFIIALQGVYPSRN
jgi:microcystin-dependent protein